MRRYLTKQMLALTVSVSLLAGSVLPVFAADAELEAETSAAGYELEQAEDETPVSADEAESVIVENAETDSYAEPAELPSDDGAVISEEETENAEASSVSGDVSYEQEEADVEVITETEAVPQQDDTEEIIDDVMETVTADAAMLDEEGSDEGTIGTLSWKISGTTLTISGSGALDYSAASDTLKSKLSTITDIVIESGVTGIGDNAFADAAALKTVTIPDSVTSISASAFSGLSGLTVRGSFGKTAESFAKTKGFAFEPSSTTNISGAKVTVSPASYTYDGKAKTPSVSVTYSVTPLQAGKDYTVSYSKNVNAGTATVTVTGSGNFSGTASKTFTIAPRSLAGASVAGVASSLPFAPGGVKPVPQVKIAGAALKAGTDYQVSYSGNTKVGTATITITGKGNYNGKVQKKFSIVKTSLKKTKIEKIPAKIYTGKKIKPDPVIKLNGVRLKKGQDYTLKYKKNKNVGMATVTIKGKGNYKGTVKKKFKIKKATIADAAIKGLKDKEYTGDAITQKLKVKIGGKTLKSGKEYTVSYSNNVSVGTASVTLKGKGNYKGTRTLQFKITRRSIEGATVSGLSEQGYTGKAVKPDITVKVAGRTLKKGRDYKLKFANNVNIGTASVTIRGIGNYKDTVTASFRIVRQSVANAQISVNDCTYNGMDQMPAVRVSLKGKSLKAGTDYKVLYTNNVNIGTARVTVTGMGIYEGQKSASFKILPPKAKFKNVINSGSNVLVTWNVDKTGNYIYQIQASNNRSFSNPESRQVLGVAQYTFQNRQTNNSYFRIRTVYNKNGTDYYSDWTTW